MHIAVQVPKGLIPASRNSEFQLYFAVRTQVHLKHLGIEWKTTLLSADPIFEVADADRTAVTITVSDPPLALQAEDSRRAFSELLEITMSEILDALEIRVAPVAVTISLPGDDQCNTKRRST